MPNLGGLIKSIRNIMMQDVGLNGGAAFMVREKYKRNQKSKIVEALLIDYLLLIIGIEILHFVQNDYNFE